MTLRRTVRYSLSLALAAVSAVALAAPAVGKTSVSMGGKPVPLSSVVVGGRTYVSLAELQAALGAAGGSNPLASAEGCMNQWLFDGVWRLRATKTEFKPNAKNGTFWGWILTVELRNGTQNLLSMYHAGLEKGVSLALQDGNTLGLGRNSASPPLAFADNLFKDLPSGAGVVMPLWFYGPDGATDEQVQANPPAKLLVPIDLKAQTYHNLKLPYSSSPNFRVDLTCSK